MDTSKIINEYYDMVYRIVYSKLTNKADSRDICQNVFIKFLEKINEFEDEEHVKWWLIRVVINACKSYEHSGWSKNVVYISDDLEGVLENKAENFSVNDKYYVESDIYETVDSLPKKYSSILKLFYFDDISIEEISSFTSLNENTIKTRLRRAKNLLKVCMDSKDNVTHHVFNSLKSQLQEYFEKYRQYYIDNNLYKKFGYGNRIAILNIDLCNGWTRTGNPFKCDVDEAIPAIVRLLDAARSSEADIPIYFSKVKYKKFLDNLDQKRKFPLDFMMDMEYLYSIDSRIGVESGEFEFSKNGISCFNDTNLHESLQKDGIDTLIITGVTAGAAIRHTIMDAFYLGYSVIVPKEAVADRIEGAKQWNLFDIDMNFGDVENIDNVISYINNLQQSDIEEDRIS